MLRLGSKAGCTPAGCQYPFQKLQELLENWLSISILGRRPQPSLKWLGYPRGPLWEKWSNLRIMVEHHRACPHPHTHLVQKSISSTCWVKVHEGPAGHLFTLEKAPVQIALCKQGTLWEPGPGSTVSSQGAVEGSRALRGRTSKRLNGVRNESGSAVWITPLHIRLVLVYLPMGPADPKLLGFHNTGQQQDDQETFQ